MEDFSHLCGGLQSEYNTRTIPFSLRDYVLMCLKSLADLVSEDRPEQFHSAMARFFAALYGGNELFNALPMPSRNTLNSVTIGVPPRRLLDLLNDFARVINELSLLEMSSIAVRSALQKNGFPYRPNELFSLIEQAEQLELTASYAAEEPGQSQTEPPAVPVVRTFSQWQELLSWAPRTWTRRRNDFPECFTDVPGENACSIREPELTLWLASAENKSRSPFEKT
jgi:hypothetical protein